MPTATDARIDAETIEEWLARGHDFRLLDVRSPAEFETVRIPGSHNVPLEVLHVHADHLQRHLDVPVVVVCRSGARSEQASRTLAGAGMEHVHVLAGGIVAWDDGRRTVDRGQPRWAMDRQVRLVAGSLVLTGIVGSLFKPKMKFLAGGVGFGLTFSALTNTCAMARVLGALPYNRGPRADVNAVVRRLTGAPT